MGAVVDPIDVGRGHPGAGAAIAAAVSLASTLVIFARLLAHPLKGTPEPLLSTLPTVIFAPPSFLVIGILHRRCARQLQD